MKLPPCVAQLSESDSAHVPSIGQHAPAMGIAPSTGSLPRPRLRLQSQVTFPPLKTHRPEAARAGAIYFAIVFAAGFALGTVRVLFLIPQVGELLAVLLELPLMLGISWFASAKIIARFQVPPRIPARATMGAVAFALLMVAELTLSLTLFGSSINDFAQTLTTPHGIIGLAGQILFGLMPVIQLKSKTQ